VKVFLAASALAIVPLGASAQNDLQFSEVVKGATAITELSNGMILIAKLDGGFLCEIAVREDYVNFKKSGQKDYGDVPRSWCMSLDNFKRFGE